jgi:hypothetical protein
MRRRSLLVLAVTPLDFIWRASQHYGVDYNWLRRTASCETGGTFNPNVKSKNGLYKGLFQFSDGTWAWMSAQAGYEGYSPYDPEAASMTAAWAFANGYRRHWPRCSYA